MEVGNKELESKACNVLSWSYQMIGDGLLSRAEELSSKAAAMTAKTYHSRIWWEKRINGELPENMHQYSLALSHDSTKKYI